MSYASSTIVMRTATRLRDIGVEVNLIRCYMIREELRGRIERIKLPTLLTATKQPTVRQTHPNTPRHQRLEYPNMFLYGTKAGSRHTAWNIFYRPILTWHFPRRSDTRTLAISTIAILSENRRHVHKSTIENKEQKPPMEVKQMNEDKDHGLMRIAR